jgi:hypothetical protein
MSTIETGMFIDIRSGRAGFARPRTQLDNPSKVVNVLAEKS